MKTNKQYLPELQSNKLKDLLASADFQTLRACIASELAVAQCELLEAEIWKEETEAALQRAKNLRFNAQQYTNALELLDRMATERYQFFEVQITTD